MTDVLQQDGPARRLADESVAWLTTVGAEGSPSPRRSGSSGTAHRCGYGARRRPAKSATSRRILESALHLADDGYGGNIITIEGIASFEEAPPELLAAYLAKYAEAIRTALQTSPEQLAADYPTTVRITPTRTRAW